MNRPPRLKASGSNKFFRTFDAQPSPDPDSPTTARIRTPAGNTGRCAGHLTSEPDGAGKGRLFLPLNSSIKKGVVPHMRSFKLLLACAFALALGASGVAAQSQTFTDSAIDYTLELPSALWKATAKPDNIHQHMEFVNGTRNDGYLRIRKEVVDAGTKAPDLANRDLDVKLRFIPGFVEGKQERFAGRLNGVAATYEFTSAGKPMTGIIYYLQANNRTIYTLHFTGQRDKLQRLRNQTDAIARSFKLK
jgi:hypothetical protein